MWQFLGTWEKKFPTWSPWEMVNMKNGKLMVSVAWDSNGGIPIPFIFAFLGIHGFQTLPPDFWTTKNAQKKNKWTTWVGSNSWYMANMLCSWVLLHDLFVPWWFTNITKNHPKQKHICNIISYLTCTLPPDLVSFFFGATQTHTMWSHR